MTASPIRSDAVAALGGAIAACRLCVTAPLATPLPHEPRPVVQLSARARLLIAGQAPGTRVHASGLPFDDASGDRLRDWLGLGSAEFYDAARVAIVPMGFCFPGQDAKGGDLPPRRECRAAWHDRIFATMPQLSVLVLIGAYAQDYHLRRLGLEGLRRGSLTETVANWRAFAALRAPQVFVLPHPSWRNTGWLKKNPWFGANVLPLLRAAVQDALR